jgi:hypothetical protein
MNHHRESKEKKLSKDMINEKSFPIKQTNHYRSCLKANRSSHQQSNENQPVRLSTYRVSFVHSNLPDGKIHVTSQSQIDLNEKKHRSDMFVKKAREFQLAEISYFKDHARDKEPLDE